MSLSSTSTNTSPQCATSQPCKADRVLSFGASSSLSSSSLFPGFRDWDFGTSITKPSLGPVSAPSMAWQSFPYFSNPFSAFPLYTDASSLSLGAYMGDSDVVDKWSTQKARLHIWSSNSRRSPKLSTS